MASEAVKRVRALSLSAGKLWDLWSTHTSTSGGSRETEVKALAVSPVGHRRCHRSSRWGRPTRAD